MGKIIVAVNGADGQIELMTDRVVIHRRGILNLFKHGFHARREIPLSSITSINFREATFFKLGEIDFDFAGRSQTDRRQNTVIFAKKHQHQFLRLKEKAFEMMQQNRK